MSESHVGQITWTGRRHRPESLKRMQMAHFGGDPKKMSTGGYVYIWAPDHPHAVNGRIPEQVAIAERALGRMLGDGEVVHHINGIKEDNRPENLLICSGSYHKWLHAKMGGFGTKIQSKPQRDLVTGRFSYLRLS